MAEPEYKQYSRPTAIVELADWTPEFDMTGVAIHPDDAATGHPKAGDKIRRQDQERWLMTAEYFAANYVAV